MSGVVTCHSLSQQQKTVQEDVPIILSLLPSSVLCIGKIPNDGGMSFTTMPKPADDVPSSEMNDKSEKAYFFYFQQWHCAL